MLAVPQRTAFVDISIRQRRLARQKARCFLLPWHRPVDLSGAGAHGVEWTRLWPQLFLSLLVSLFDSLIQRLQHARIHRSDDIHRRVQFFVGHPGFPCVRKAPFYSRVTKSHHRHRQANEHLLAVS